MPVSASQIAHVLSADPETINLDGAADALPPPPPVAPPGATHHGVEEEEVVVEGIETPAGSHFASKIAFL